MNNEAKTTVVCCFLICCCLLGCIAAICATHAYYYETSVRIQQIDADKWQKRDSERGE